jgi:GNAT superfamily N-acetyltransferase
MPSTKYRIIEVTDAATRKAFLDLPRSLYANDPEFVCPLDMEVDNIFNPAKNKNFAHGNATRYIAQDPKGRTVGRIGVFYDDRKFAKTEHKVGGVGFFESVLEQDVAFALFDAAKAWLEKNGVEGMDGPVNFGANHQHWGLLVGGFRSTAVGMPYNHSYYQGFFEEYGFRVFFKQQSRELLLGNKLPERFAKVAEYAQQRNKIQIQIAHRPRLKEYLRDFIKIFNEAWQYHEGFIPLQEKELDEILKELALIYIEDLFVFAYVDGDPAGFAIVLPDLNQVFKPLRGKFPWYEALLFLWRKRNKYAWYRRHGKLTRIRMLIMGVRPKYQKMGVDAILSHRSREIFANMGFTHIELSWVGDFNPKMQSLAEATGAEPSSVHHTYRFMFDPALRDQYSMVIPVDTKEKFLEHQQEDDASPEA